MSTEDNDLNKNLKDSKINKKAVDTNLNKKLRDLKIDRRGDINILLLGETGVGKSTFINSVTNYLTYSDLEKAERENLLVLIPSKCGLRDKNGVDHVVKIGVAEDTNEYLNTGVSATQDVKSYVFPIWNGKTKVRLIDTPGMGDTRGIQQDDVNCENILSYIGQLHELHAICFLFKPTTTRITQFFEYCMLQIFSRLDKSASKNIVFVFTNTRGTDYGPGDTFQILQEVVKSIESSRPDVKIPLDKNVFCFDNEAFRYLAAIKQGIEFDNSVRHKNKESWKKSVNQCWGLIKYIVGDAQNPPVKPHFIKSTSAINEARRLIMRLSQPLAEITQLINDNLLALQQHRNFLVMNTGSIEELKKKLYMPIIDLKVVKLTQPVTVCTNSKCAEIYKVGNTNKWHYKQKCHSPCYLRNVAKEIIGSPELARCDAMNSAGTCQKCNCNFSIHMHIYYMSETVENHIIDPNVQQNIDDKQRVMQKVSALIDEISQKKSELEKEHDLIVKCCAKFAHFLQTNAISPFSDSYKEYILYLIFREKSLGELTNTLVVQHLETLLKQYEESKRSFDEALKLQKKIGEPELYITPQKIQETITELYKLKYNGKKIKELYECQKTSRNKEYSNTEYVHQVVIKKDKKNKTDKENVKKCEEAQKDPEKQTKQPYKVKVKDSQPKNVKDSQSKNAKDNQLKNVKDSQSKATKESKVKTTKESQSKTTKESQSKTTKESQSKNAKDSQSKNTKDNQPKSAKNSQPKNVNVEGQHRELLRTPPPSYQDSARHFPPAPPPPLPPHYPPQNSAGYLPPPPPSQGAYHPPSQGAYHPPSPYPPPPPGAYPPPVGGPDPYHYPARYDTRVLPERSEGAESYELKISVTKPIQGQNPLPRDPPPREPYHPSHYDYSRSYSQGVYPPPHSGHPLPPGGYPPASSGYHPPAGAYSAPPSAYPPPPSAYPPSGAYSPPGGYPHSYHYDQAHNDYFNQGSSAHASQLMKKQVTRDGVQGDTGNKRSEKGRGGINKNQKFKKRSQKKKAGKKDKENDSDGTSDSSTSS